MTEGASPIRLVCGACGAAPPPDDPFRCPAAGRDDRDHLVGRTVDWTGREFPGGGDPNPFLRYGSLLYSHAVWREGWPVFVASLDEALARIDGHGFRETPFELVAELGRAVGLAGGVWVKNETVNVGGSHKARHLFGLALVLAALDRLGLRDRRQDDARGLAIASCGNAALGAAVVARAAERPLTVFIPPDAEPVVVARLRALGARIEVCDRAPGVKGDPCYLAFRAAVETGAIPFCCQGPDNGLTIEGGMTLAWEMVSVLRGRGQRLDRLFVQVGGGALGSACIQGLREAVRLGALERLPRLHAVQTAGGFPLRRAYERVRARAIASLGWPMSGDAWLADRLAAPEAARAIDEALTHARTHRSEYMWPWETAPHSIAHGILDDETYDWWEIVAGMLASGGWPITVGEARLAEAIEVGRRTTGIAVDATGAAGLAGLLELQATPSSSRLGHGEAVAVLFTGASRAA